MPEEFPFLPFALPELGDEELVEIASALKSGWVTTGTKSKRFEDAFHAFLGEPQLHCMAVNSATAGLHLALEALGIGLCIASCSMGSTAPPRACRAALRRYKMKFLTRKGFLIEEQGMIYLTDTAGRCVNDQGFSLHAEVCCAAHQRKKVQHLCRYITGPAIANERLALADAGAIGNFNAIMPAAGMMILSDGALGPGGRLWRW